MSARLPDELGNGQLRWGDELEIKPIGGASGAEPGRCAGYHAKYATKSTELARGVLTRVREDEIDYQRSLGGGMAGRGRARRAQNTCNQAEVDG